MPQTLKQISIFEETHEDYVTLLQRDPLIRERSEITRVTSPAVSAAFAKRSLGLEKLSVAFMVEASDFFQSCQQHWVWSHMRSLTLTSRILTPAEDPKIQDLLRNAAMAALSMPCLHTMVIWNGCEQEAIKFFYRATSTHTCIGWRGTWDLSLESNVTRTWEKVAVKHTGNELRVTPEPQISGRIDSTADAIDLLDLPSEVILPETLLQMQRESEWRRDNFEA